MLCVCHPPPSPPIPLGGTVSCVIRDDGCRGVGDVGGVPDLTCYAGPSFVAYAFGLPTIEPARPGPVAPTACGSRAHRITGRSRETLLAGADGAGSVGGQRARAVAWCVSVCVFDGVCRGVRGGGDLGLIVRECRGGNQVGTRRGCHPPEQGVPGAGAVVKGLAMPGHATSHSFPTKPSEHDWHVPDTPIERAYSDSDACVYVCRVFAASVCVNVTCVGVIMPRVSTGRSTRDVVVLGGSFVIGDMSH